jgi:hypothetical protein
MCDLGAPPSLGRNSYAVSKNNVLRKTTYYTQFHFIRPIDINDLVN